MAATSDLNTVAIIGNLTRDAELSYFNNGGAVAKFSIASNRSRKDGDQWISEANFFEISYFGKPAEAIKPYLLKGKKVAIQGSLKQDRWEKDGQKFSKVTIVANSVELLGGRAENSDSYSNSESSQGYQPRPTFTQNQTQNPSYSSNEESYGGDTNSFPDDIPF